MFNALMTEFLSTCELQNALDSHVSVEVSGVTAMKDVIKKLRTQISNVKEYEGSSAIPELNKGLTIIRLRKSDNSNHLIRSGNVLLFLRFVLIETSNWSSS